jgi:hypothetical protein
MFLWIEVCWQFSEICLNRKGPFAIGHVSRPTESRWWVYSYKRSRALTNVRDSILRAKRRAQDDVPGDLLQINSLFWNGRLTLNPNLNLNLSLSL